MKVSDLSKLVARTYVNEIEIRKVQIGMRADINVSAYRDRRFEGKVWKIAPTATLRDNIRSFEVAVLLENAASELRPQMTADVDIIVAEREGVLQMPISALIEKDVTTVHAFVPEQQVDRFVVGARLDVSFPDDMRRFHAVVDQVYDTDYHFDQEIRKEVRIVVDDNPNDLQWGPTSPMTLSLLGGETFPNIMCDIRKERDPYALRLVGAETPPDDPALIETEEARLTIGERNDHSIEILNGLSAGDRVRTPELSRRDLFNWDE